MPKKQKRGSKRRKSVILMGFLRFTYVDEENSSKRRSDR